MALCEAHAPYDVDLHESSAISVAGAAAARLRQVLDGSRQVRILILSSDTGGGHRASAAALRSALEHLHPEHVSVEIVDFWVDLAGGSFKAFPSQYAFLAKHPWLWKLSYQCMRFPPIRGAVEVSFNVLAHKNIRNAFRKYAPDLIISVHPLVNTLSLRVLDAMRADTGFPSPPFVTVVTDLGGAHPTWFNPKVDKVYVPNEAVMEIAKACNVPDTRIQRVGLPVRDTFWYKPTASRHQLRSELGMHPDLPALLLIGGGDGVGNLGPVAKAIAVKIVRDLGSEAAQIVVICGKNKPLLDSLQRHTWRLPIVLKAFVNNVSDWMAACDILCTKAGPGTIAEGLIRGLPILLTGFLPGQEEANVRFVVDNGAGQFSPRPNRIAAIAAEWIAKPRLRNQLSACALKLGRPNASTEIVADIMQVARAKLSQNATALERLQRIRQAQRSLARSHLVNAAVAASAGSQSLALNTGRSHLLLRMKILLRVVFGSLILTDAVSCTTS